MASTSEVPESPAAEVLPQRVIVHPIVLLSTVDHYNRVNLQKRVVGALLGSVRDGVVDITNCYAVPFDEDKRNPNIWFLDHNYHEAMFAMFKKVSANERVVGWYSTGPRIRPADIDVNEVFRRYTPNPVLVIIDVRGPESGNTLDIPTKAYISVEEVEGDSATDETNKESKLQFQHIPSEIGALEAEEVGVEHLLRDIKDTSVSSLSTRITDKMLSLKSLTDHLRETREYLENVCSGKLPVNHFIISQLQDIFNLMPNLNHEHIVKAFAVKTHDSLLVIYLSSFIRSIIALHNLINNKIANKEAEKKLIENPDATTEQAAASSEANPEEESKTVSDDA